MADEKITTDTAVRIKPRDPAMAAGAEKLAVLAIGTSKSSGRDYALVENEWGIVAVKAIGELEVWPEDAQ